MAVVLMSIRNIRDEKIHSETENKNTTSYNENSYTQICNEKMLKAQQEFEIILRQCKKIMDMAN